MSEPQSDLFALTETAGRLRSVRSIPSLIKWTGSKRSQAARIRELMPEYRYYLEPFVGGGAILFIAAVPGSVASDIYAPLIGLWKLIQSAPLEVIANYGAQWSALSEELDGLDMNALPTDALIPRYFYDVRERFNRSSDPLDLNFIMRTCVNGIVRFNDKGQFNNSFHLSRRGMEPGKFAKVVHAWHRRLVGVEFICQDFSRTMERAGPNDFVYLDPPYAGNKQRYAEDLNLPRFFAELEALNVRGVKWALSFDGRRGGQDLTHDVPRELYKRHELLSSGNSAVNKVLNGPIELVEESLYLNY